MIDLFVNRDIYLQDKQRYDKFVSELKAGNLPPSASFPGNMYALDEAALAAIRQNPANVRLKTLPQDPTSSTRYITLIPQDFSSTTAKTSQLGKAAFPPSQKARPTSTQSSTSTPDDTTVQRDFQKQWDSMTSTYLRAQPALRKLETLSTEIKTLNNNSLKSSGLFSGIRQWWNGRKRDQKLKEAQALFNQLQPTLDELSTSYQSLSYQAVMNPALSSSASFRTYNSLTTDFRNHNLGPSFQTMAAFKLCEYEIFMSQGLRSVSPDTQYVGDNKLSRIEEGKKWERLGPKKLDAERLFTEVDRLQQRTDSYQPSERSSTPTRTRSTSSDTTSLSSRGSDRSSGVFSMEEGSDTASRRSTSPLPEEDNNDDLYA
ncbi:MAG: hypothetical protein JSS62_04150 [Verrucomicrobia bacterium]|nr:hypothetical protein [Verrucomicrobiota bacterium]MBS0645414.1 hypothetical protein [Verrucomicrobiota bacterium]